MLAGERVAARFLTTGTENGIAPAERPGRGERYDLRLAFLHDGPAVSGSALDGKLERAVVPDTQFTVNMRIQISEQLFHV